MTASEIYTAIQNNSITVLEFSDWLSDEKFESYQEGIRDCQLDVDEYQSEN